MLPISAVFPLGLVLLFACFAVGSYVARVKWGKGWADAVCFVGILGLVLIAFAFILSVEHHKFRISQLEPPDSMEIKENVYKVFFNEETGKPYIIIHGEFVPVHYVNSYYQRNAGYGGADDT